MKFVKYDGMRREMVREVYPRVYNFHEFLFNRTPAEAALYARYDDHIRVEDAYWDEEREVVIMLAVDYFGTPLYAEFPTWAAYYEEMLNHLLGPV